LFNTPESTIPAADIGTLIQGGQDLPVARRIQGLPHPATIIIIPTNTTQAPSQSCGDNFIPSMNLSHSNAVNMYIPP
jgi:hypothetical protein